MDAEKEVVKRSLFRRIFNPHTLMVGGLGSVGLLILAAGVTVLGINWLGRRTYDQGRAADVAAGETYDLAKLVAPPVPDEQNFAGTPLLAPLLKYERVDGATKWQNHAGVERVQSAGLFNVTEAGLEGPNTGNWEVQRLTDWKEWQEYYRSVGGFPLPEKEGKPAEDVLSALGKYREELEELREASHRTYAQFPLHKHVDEGFNMLLPHLAVLKRLSICLRLHALAALEAGQPDLALADLRLGFRVLQAAQSEPILISQLVDFACVAILTQPIWEGMARGQWKAQHLEMLQKQLQGVNQFQGLLNGMRGERAFVNQGVLRWISSRPDPEITRAVFGEQQAKQWDWAIRLVPRGFFYYNLARINDYHRNVIQLAASAAAGTGGSLADYKKMDASWQNQMGQSRWDRVLLRTMVPALAKSDTKARRSQATVNMALTACAVERFKMETGKYPATLAELIPKYLAKVPRDPMDGQPLRYRLDPEGAFVIHSIGTDGRDQGGVITYNRARTGVNPDAGDMVWAYKTQE